MIKKKILVIGGNGFIGKNLVKYARDYLNDDDVQLLILARTEVLDFYKQENIRYLKGDYRDVNFLDELFKIEKFTDVFHFASTTIPVSSNQNIVGDVNDNLMATVNLLDVMMKNGCSFILYLSSGGAVYGEFKNDKLGEDHSCDPISSYGVIKLTIEQYIRLYFKQSGINYLILRISNPYGPFHTSEKQGVINIAIRKALNNMPLEIWGNGEQAKDYIYVEDIVNIIWLLIRSDVVNEILNVGSGVTLSLNAIVEKIRIDIPHFNVYYKDALSSDVEKFCLNMNKLNRLISFKLTPIDQGLIKTLEWEKAIKNG